METSEATWRKAFEEVRSQWECHEEAFRTQILEGDWLNRQKYRVPRTTRELDGLEALFAASEPQLPDTDACGRYGKKQLSKACKKGHALPGNPLFDALDRLEEASDVLRSALDQWLRWTRREALVEVRESVRGRIRTDRRLAYDDLLIELEDALGRAGGARLAERIRREFPCALIDEYQDTDPVQARIFHRIYGEARSGSAATGGPKRGEAAGATGSESDGSGAATGTLEAAPAAPSDSGWMDAPEPAKSAAGDGIGASARSDRTPPGPFIVVGDPKQSIYRFRGADVFAYLAARRTAREASPSRPELALRPRLWWRQ